MALLLTIEELGDLVTLLLSDTAQAVQLCRHARDSCRRTVARYRQLRECEAGPLLSAEPLPLDDAATGKRWG